MITCHHNGTKISSVQQIALDHYYNLFPKHSIRNHFHIGEKKSLFPSRGHAMGKKLKTKK